MKRAAMAVGLLLALLAVPVSGLQAQSTTDTDLPVGHFYNETGGSAGPNFGYRITDEGGIGLWDEFQRLGGVAALGYPISRRFIQDGFVEQATQKVILQWRPDLTPPQATFVNVFDKLHDLGLDRQLQNAYQIPPQLDPSFDAGKSPAQVQAARLTLLDADPAIATWYNPRDPNSVTYNGLPTSTITNAGPFLILRAQRAAIQHWLVDNPASGVSAGDVTQVNGGDIAKGLGLIPADATRPETLQGALAPAPAPPSPPVPVAPAPPPAPTPVPYPFHWKPVTTPPTDCSPDPTVSAIQCLSQAGNIGTQYIKGRVMTAKGDHVIFGYNVQVSSSAGTSLITLAGDGTFTVIIGQGCPQFTQTYSFELLDSLGAQASDVHSVTYTGDCNNAGEFHFDFLGNS
ncbi:MAG: hypothetical protein JO247_12815 [Chloroflexi bacterium]|nr:hypothetical protein [Chloroflexota bacterium]